MASVDPGLPLTSNVSNFISFKPDGILPSGSTIPDVSLDMAVVAKTLRFVSRNLLEMKGSRASLSYVLVTTVGIFPDDL